MSPKLSIGFEKSLTVQGCCKGFVFAGNEDDTVMLVFKLDLAGPGKSKEYNFDLDGDSKPMIYITQGESLRAGFCEENKIENVEARYQAVSGKGSIKLEEGLETLNLNLEEIKFQKELKKHEITLAGFEIQNVRIKN